MIGLDTNVLVRYFAQDAPVQTRKANALIESLTAEQPGFVTLVALVETVWVLGLAYDAPRSSIVEVVETLLRTKEIHVEAAETVWKAVRLYAASTADFADCLIERTGHEALCEYTATFDVKAAKATGMRLIK